MGWPQKVAGMPDMLVVMGACLEGRRCCSGQIVLNQDVTMQARREYRTLFEALATEVELWTKRKNGEGNLLLDQH